MWRRPDQRVRPRSLGWPDTCPDFEHGSCDNPIADCGGIAGVPWPVSEARPSIEAMSPHYDELALPSAPTRC